MPGNALSTNRMRVAGAMVTLPIARLTKNMAASKPTSQYELLEIDLPVTLLDVHLGMDQGDQGFKAGDQAGRRAAH